MHKNIDNEYDHMIIVYSSFTRSPLHDHHDEACVLSGIIVLEYFWLQFIIMIQSRDKIWQFFIEYFFLLFTHVFQGSVFKVST